MWLLWFLLIVELHCGLALYEQCNHQMELRPGQKVYINSPYYPGEYPAGTSCRYTVKAPTDYVLSFKCELQLRTAVTDTNCEKEVFHFNAEGDELLTRSEFFCGSGKVERQSFLNRAVISYISQRGVLPKFRDKLKAQFSISSNSNSTTSTTTTTTTTPAPLTESESLTDSVLHVLEDVGVSDALAYMAALLYNEPDAGAQSQAIASTTYLEQLPNSYAWRPAKSAVASVKRAKIVTSLVGYPAGVPGGGRFTCLVEALAPICECGWSMTLKIASPVDSEAALNEFPSMAGVLTKRQGKIFCGAAIIHQRYLISGAHCFLTPETGSASLLRVVVGEHDLSSLYESLYTQHYDLDALIPHEKFSRTNGQIRNDIALLRTRLPMIWSRSVGPACLPLRPVDGKKLPHVGQQVVAAGWGTTSFGGPQSQRLLKTTLDVIDVAQCRRLLGAPAHTFCTYTPGKDTCQYDSGGALYERSSGRLVAVGIVSYGYACATEQPSVNTRVASFVKWIRAKTPEVKYCVR
ncbi:serine proteinase stubble [Scaptodrosophila lebanonensis]|uniref:Serine proteinase stubble n=1 Tax=Drosophila lebanonensis TaxID=7225 RepID=A0A6J2UID9_DROLE|nr:serine proteinase stubble [Scaptodrosophila lebanonensis]